MPIVSVVGKKGGIGKSTIAISLAAEAFERGQQVLLVDADPTASARTWSEVAAERGHTAPSVIAMGATMHQPGQLQRVAQGYDLVLVDTPPFDDERQRSAIAVSDVALLPCAPSVLEAWALASTARLIAEAQSFRERKGLAPLRAFVVVTRKKPKTAIGKSVRDVLAKTGLPILKTELCDRVTYTEFATSGRGLAGYAPSSLAAREVQRLSDEIAEMVA